mgnify:CR=1 FL=1
MEILDKKSNRMSRVIVGVSERSEFPKLQRILDFLSLRNLLSNELFFTFLFYNNLFIFFNLSMPMASIYKYNLHYLFHILLLLN